MRTLEHIDLDLPLEISAMSQDLDTAVICQMDQQITLRDGDVKLLMAFAKEHWRNVLERDLQSLAMDKHGNNLLSTWMPLVTFRTEFCGGGRHLQDEATQALMERLRTQTRDWRAAGCDVVDISGRIVK